nr:DUF4192 family protein [Micromonospora sp. 4G55]
MTATDRPRLTVRSPADLLAAVPYLLGFHPADSVVVVAMRAQRVVFAARADLPDRGADPRLPADHLGASSAGRTPTPPPSSDTARPTGSPRPSTRYAPH